MELGGGGEGENGDAKWQRSRQWLRRERGWYPNCEPEVAGGGNVPV